MERPRRGKLRWSGKQRKDWRVESLGIVQFLPSLKGLCGRRLEPTDSPQNRHLTSHLQSMGRNQVSWIVPVKKLSLWRQETFLSLCFMALDEHKCSESNCVIPAPSWNTWLRTGLYRLPALPFIRSDFTCKNFLLCPSIKQECPFRTEVVSWNLNRKRS